jgi:hypothetical protein
MLKRIALEGAGWLLVILGIAALILPGPGLLCLFAGLALLSQRYEWAARRVEPVRLAALKGAAQSVQTWPRILMSCLGVAWLVGFGILWIVGPPIPGWWPNWWNRTDKLWLIGGVGAGVSLVVSGILAGALVVYSLRRFRGSETTQAEVAGRMDRADSAVDQ